MTAVPLCIVTGYDDNGLAVIDHVAPFPGFDFYAHTPGFASSLAWQMGAFPTVRKSLQGTGRPASVLPDLGGTSVIVVEFPPDSAELPSDFNPQAAGDELCARLPGLGECFEPDAPGFHRTDTIDYGVVLQGEMTLDLDGGRTQVVRQGDVVVQNGTRHAWRNHTNRPSRMLFVMIGASRR